MKFPWSHPYPTKKQPFDFQAYYTYGVFLYGNFCGNRTKFFIIMRFDLNKIECFIHIIIDNNYLNIIINEKWNEFLFSILYLRIPNIFLKLYDFKEMIYGYKIY